MCRRKQLCAVALLAFGLGMLVAGVFESTFFCGCVGFFAMVAGVVLWQKK